MSMGREPIQIVEIDQAFCQLDYGVSPCTAAIGVTGERKCFNTFVTCQDTANFDDQGLTLRFARSQDNLPADTFLIPSVIGVTTTPTEINAAGTDSDASPLGQRATVRVTFQDHPYSDVLVDKYRDERNYIATDRGTFWGKWLARNPYYNNHIIRIKDGYVGEALGDMVTRTYIIDRIDGPDSRGRVTVRGKDILKLADNERAQAPAASQGELIVDINDTTTADLRITGAAASEYPAPGTVRINDELFTYAGVSTISSTEINLTGIARATDGTEADDHDAGDRVQLCLRYTDIRPDVLAREWLEDYGDVPAQYIDDAAWDAEGETWLNQFQLSGLITEPTGVTDLLAEITEQCMFYIWWDERQQLINMKTVRPAAQDAVTLLNDSQHILAESVQIEESPKDRVSQVWVFYGQRDPTVRLDEETNYRRVRVRADLNAESADQYGEQRIKKIYSRWLNTGTQALQTTTRLLNRFRDNPRYLSISLDAKDRDLWSADLADVTLDEVVDDTGAPLATRWTVVSAEESEPGHRVDYRLQKFEYGLGKRFAFIDENGEVDFTAASDEEKAFGCFLAGPGDTMSDGSEPYRLL